MDKSMSYNRTLMNFVQRTKKQMRKTNRHTRNKSVQKHTSLKEDGVEMRNRPQRMTRYPKEKISSLRKLSIRDPRIRTPLDRRLARQRQTCFIPLYVVAFLPATTLMPSLSTLRACTQRFPLKLPLLGGLSSQQDVPPKRGLGRSRK